MNTAYQPPESSFNDDNADDAPKKRWKVFFWLVLVLEIFSIISFFTDAELNIYEAVAEFIFYSFVLLGLFGFAYKKRIFNPMIWKVFIPLLLIYDIYSIATVELGPTEDENEFIILAIFTAAIIIPLMLFQYMALIKYAFKSTSLWK